MQKKKKKSLKNSHKSCFWHFRKTAKKKKYTIKNTYIYLHTNYIYKYIYIYTAEPQERLRKALEAGGGCNDSAPISLTCTPLRQKGTGDGRG